jgi:uncharacterized membrane protein
MKRTDIDQIRADGLISESQHAAIVSRYGLDRDTNRLLLILGIIGGILVVSGGILVVSANWDSIPKALKLAGGLAFLVAAHFAGWRLGRSENHPAMAMTLHFIGSGLFLANIALVGQVYNLGSRPPNAVLLWLVGIAPLPWILRSRAQHILTLSVLGVWLGLELGEKTGPLNFGSDARICVFYSMLGVMFIGLGGVLKRSRFPEFAGATEKFGLLGLHLASFPLMLGFFYEHEAAGRGAWFSCGLVTALALVALFQSLRRGDEELPAQWRWTWLFCLVGIIALAWFGMTWRSQGSGGFSSHGPGPHWIVIPVLFGFSLIQLQVGLHRRIPFFVNLGIVSIAVQLLTAYLQLFGSMMDTGLIFLSTGVFLIALGWYLERQRRSLVQSMGEPRDKASLT